MTERCDDDDDDDPYVYSPIPVLPEIYADLDLMLLTATTDEQRWPALITATHEALDRFDHLADPKVFCTLAGSVLSSLAGYIRYLEAYPAPELAGWLKEVSELLAAQQELQLGCAKQIRQASGHDDTVAAILDGASSLHAVALHVTTHRFSDLPPYHPPQPDYQLMGIALGVMSAEIDRNPLSKQLDGVGARPAPPNSTPTSRLSTSWNWPPTATSTAPCTDSPNTSASACTNSSTTPTRSTANPSANPATKSPRR